MTPAEFKKLKPGDTVWLNNPGFETEGKVTWTDKKKIQVIWVDNYYRFFKTSECKLISLTDPRLAKK